MIKAILLDYGGVISKGGKAGKLPASISGVHDDLYEISKKLRNRGYLVGILSNVRPKSAKKLKKKGRYDSFCPVILSCEVKMKKPSEAVFKHALSILGLKADQVLFVDNSKRHIKTAEKLGINTIHVKSHKKLISELEETFAKPLGLAK